MPPGYHAGMKRRQFIFAGVALTAVLAGGYGASRTWFGSRPEGETAGVAPGLPAARPLETGAAALAPGSVPDELWNLALPDLAGAEQAMSQWRGKRVVVNFWATWCAPCVKEMPDLQALADQHPDKRIIGIGIDSAANIRAFLQKVPVTYPLLVAETGGVDLLRRLGNTRGGLPFTLILDEDGRIAHHVLGQIDPEDIGRRLAG